MSSKKYKVKCFYCKVKDKKAGRESRRLRHLWFDGDRCAPSELSTEELKARRALHMVELGRLQPSSRDYLLQLALAHLYEALLVARQPVKVKVKVSRA